MRRLIGWLAQTAVDFLTVIAVLLILGFAAVFAYVAAEHTDSRYFAVVTTLLGAFVGSLLGILANVQMDDWKRKRYGPQLALTFPPSLSRQDKHLVTIWKDSHYEAWMRLKVTNTKQRPAEQVRCYITKIEQRTPDGRWVDTEFADSCPLIWSGDQDLQAISIPKDVDLYVDVISMRNDPRLCDFSIEFQGNYPARYSSIITDTNQWYRVTVIAVSSNCPTETIQIEVQRTNNPLEAVRLHKPRLSY